MISKQDILKAHILIVDDLEANVALMEDLLGEAGYEHIASTMDPYAVAELHRANNYDLILLDLQMPGMDGFEVITDLKSKEGNDYLPILVITAQPAHKLRALELGAKDFISKPFDLVEVNARIRNMLEVRLLYKKLHNYNQLLEERVLERTAELRESKARYRSLIQLAADWYWEQDENGTFTRLYGPAQQMLGIQCDPLDSNNSGITQTVWNEVERSELQAKIASRQPFLDFVISRTNAQGIKQKFQVSGEPMFNQSSRFIGYRGFGVELTINSNQLNLSE